MESKRSGGQMPSNASRITHHPQTAEHQRMAISKSKSKLLKNPSEISLTPSQLAEQEQVTGRKNPLDALSRTNFHQTTVERRSGLQEVDEEYLKQNVFRKPQYQRNSGLNDISNSQQHSSATPSHAAGQPSIGQLQQQQTNQHSTASSVVTNPNASQITLGQPSSCLGPASLTAETKHSSNHVPIAGGQQQQQQVPSTVAQQQVPTHHHHHQQQQQQHLGGHHTQDYHHHHHHQTPPAMSQQPSSLIAHSMPEPEMCTTCPNCQTTIYLLPATASAIVGQNQQSAHEKTPTTAEQS